MSRSGSGLGPTFTAISSASMSKRLWRLGRAVSSSCSGSTGRCRRPCLSRAKGQPLPDSRPPLRRQSRQSCCGRRSWARIPGCPSPATIIPPCAIVSGRQESIAGMRDAVGLLVAPKELCNLVRAEASDVPPHPVPPGNRCLSPFPEEITASRTVPLVSVPPVCRGRRCNPLTS